MAAGADVYLVGAQLYRANADGSNANGPEVGLAYEFSTNEQTNHYPFPFEPGGGIAVVVPLQRGTNHFVFSTQGMTAVPIGSWAGINLFISETPTSFNPAPSFGPVAGDLTVVSRVGGGSTFVPAANTLVQCYSGPPNQAAANGRTSWQEGRVWVSQLSVTTTGGADNFVQGSFTLERHDDCLADFNDNGFLSVQDVFDFFASYFGGEFRADINGSQTLSVQDIFDFLAAYFAGCP